MQLNARRGRPGERIPWGRDMLEFVEVRHGGNQMTLGVKPG
jgi:hypothetical protein